MLRIFQTILLLTLLSAAAFAQTEKPKCSELSVRGPSAVTNPGDVQVFTAELVPAIDPSKYTITWSVDKGKINLGQGTLRIETMNSLNGETLTATADITGLGECNATESDTGVMCSCPEPFLIDEFGDLPDDELQVRLEHLYSKTKERVNSTGYIINYGPPKEVTIREKSIRSLIQFREYDPLRLILVNGGVEEKIKTRIWIVPAGADASIID